MNGSLIFTILSLLLWGRYAEAASGEEDSLLSRGSHVTRSQDPVFLLERALSGPRRRESLQDLIAEALADPAKDLSSQKEVVASQEDSQDEKLSNDSPSQWVSVAAVPSSSSESTDRVVTSSSKSKAILSTLVQDPIPEQQRIQRIIAKTLECLKIENVETQAGPKDLIQFLDTVLKQCVQGLKSHSTTCPLNIAKRPVDRAKSKIETQIKNKKIKNEQEVLEALPKELSNQLYKYQQEMQECRDNDSKFQDTSEWPSEKQVLANWVKQYKPSKDLGIDAHSTLLAQQHVLSKIGTSSLKTLEEVETALGQSLKKYSVQYLRTLEKKKEKRIKEKSVGSGQLQSKRKKVSEDGGD